MDESSNVVILEIENMTPEMERDVTVQFFSVDGTALGIHYCYFTSSVCNRYYYHNVHYISSIYLYLSFCQMGGTILACQNLSHTF